MTPKVVGIGEVLWDLLPGGRQMGGAPANFTFHARQLGADARPVTRVGRDALGQDILARLRELGVPTDCVELDDARPTGTVTVELGTDGEPHYTIHEGVAWDHLRGEAPGRRAVAAADAVCFGTLAQRHDDSRHAIRTLLGDVPPTALRVFDVNLRQSYFSRPVVEDSLRLANVLKLNETELPRLAELFGIEGDEPSRIEQLAQQFHLQAVAFTRGGRGSLLHRDGKWSDHPGVPVKVQDTIGAGDSFTAAMTLGLLAGWELDTINQRANEIAAHVASRAGGTPPLPESLCRPFQVAWAES
ncbi:carbohydrate kinase family protein [Limnoglobus roseus]|uniref:Carbohydrate kinase n=1 Tax=Limnoglobus roseus TaxID=2598579 RepID=A0A5C1AF19_9BACT|nr:carbohydrate kinase [Limnoglobus roseus]QEL18019.1 carbohydrate kinase [Limnoglobus roseus]